MMTWSEKGGYVLLPTIRVFSRCGKCYMELTIRKKERKIRFETCIYCFFNLFLQQNTKCFV